MATKKKVARRSPKKKATARKKTAKRATAKRKTAKGSTKKKATAKKKTTRKAAKRSPKKYAQLAQRRGVFRADAWPHVVVSNDRILCKDRRGNVKCFAIGE